MRIVFLLVVALAVGCSSAPVGTDGGGAGGGSGGGSAGGGAGTDGGAGGGSGGAGGGTGGGTGGGSGGGTGGTGGGAGGGTAGADAGMSCDELRNSYGKQFPSTRECNLNSLINECTASRETILGCGCKSYVNANKVAALDAISAKWTSMSCAAPICPAVVCPNALGGSCMSVDASPSAGLCQDTF